MVFDHGSPIQIHIGDEFIHILTFCVGRKGHVEKRRQGCNAHMHRSGKFKIFWEGMQNLVFLEGFSGSFLTKFLQKVDTHGLEQDIQFLANLPVKMQD